MAFGSSRLADHLGDALVMGSAGVQVEAKRKWVKKLGVGLLLLAILWVAGCALIYSNMRKSPEAFGRFMMKIPAPVAFLAFPFETLWTHARKGTLEIGDRAPDFSLATVDKSSQVQLSTLNREKPVVLIFGSYT